MIASLSEIAKRAYSSRHTINATFQTCIAAIAHDVPGDFVECGVGAGANAAAMAKAMLMGSPGRVLRLFDSFMGIPQAGPHDVEFLAAGHKAGLTAHSLDDVKANMLSWGIPSHRLQYHRGLFEDTVPAGVCLIESISVLRLDGDLYESTKVCLEHLYPLVSPGGWVIIDDFDLSGARKATLEYIGHGFGPTYFQKHTERRKSIE